MAIKDVLKSLVDDNLVEQDKVGNQNIFWSFPSTAQLVVRCPRHCARCSPLTRAAAPQ